MILDTISKIKIRAGIYASKKTGNILDGSYKSVFKGSSQNFEDLREYIPGDNIRDIDWKASSRNRKSLLVRQYVAEKKHNILVVFDTGLKMKGHTEDGHEKHDVAVAGGGLFAYLAAKNGDNVGAIYNKGELINYYQVKQGLYNVERILTDYDRDYGEPTQYGLDRVLDYVIRNVKRRMVILIVTDMVGLSKIPENILKKLVYQHDIIVLCAGDAKLTDSHSYNVAENRYLPEFITSNKRLRKKEEELRLKLVEDNEKKLKTYGIIYTLIQNEEEIPKKLNELLEKHKKEKMR